MRRVHKQLALAFAGSIAAHAAVLRYAHLPTPTHASGWRETEMVLTLAQPESEPPEPAPPEVALGLDALLPPSKTWLGFTEFQPQFGPHSPVEQAAFTENPLAAAPLLAAARHAPALHAQPSTVPPNLSAPQPPSLSARQPDGVRPELPEEQEDVPQPPAIDEPSARVPSASSAIVAMQQFMERVREMTKSREQRKPDRPAQTQPQPRLQPRAAEPAVKQTAATRDPPLERQPQQPASAGEPGAPSDRESDPSSIIETPRENWQLGKPLAAQGLEVKPRRPTMTILTTLTAWPRNPTVLVAFDRSGMPKRAVIVQSTGDSRVDSAIEACLYRWRAAGKQLDALNEGETVDLTFRLLINPERQAEDKDEP